MKSKRVLLVDDHEVFLSTATRLLQSIPGFHVVGQATCGEEAIKMAAALHPELVLMDFAMPGMNGLDATLRIKRQHDAPKVIMVTLHNGPSYRALAREAGADGFVAKDKLFVELPRLVAALFPQADRSSEGSPVSAK